MKNSLLLITLAFCLAQCTSRPEDTFSIDGKIKGEVPAYIYLHKNNQVDSTEVKNGMFRFEGKLTKPTAVYFHINEHSSMIDGLFYIEDKDIGIEISNSKKNINNLTLNFIQIDTIYGSPTEILRRNFERFSEPLVLRNS